jgi:hypothetical protein
MEDRRGCTVELTLLQTLVAPNFSGMWRYPRRAMFIQVIRGQATDRGRSPAAVRSLEHRTASRRCRVPREHRAVDEYLDLKDPWIA